MKRGVADEWLRPTLLGAAFDSGDCDKAEELAADVAAEGAARWKLDSDTDRSGSERFAGRRQGLQGSVDDDP